MAKGTLVYTQHSVAFPTLETDPGRKWVKDYVGVSDDAHGGGTHGEFYWHFMDFDSGHVGVQVLVFGDGLDTFYDRTIQKVVKKWRAMKDPDKAKPADIIDFLEREGVVPSSHHRRGLREAWNEGV